MPPEPCSSRSSSIGKAPSIDRFSTSVPCRSPSQNGASSGPRSDAPAAQGNRLSLPVDRRGENCRLALCVDLQRPAMPEKQVRPTRSAVVMRGSGELTDDHGNDALPTVSHSGPSRERPVLQNNCPSHVSVEEIGPDNFAPLFLGVDRGQAPGQASPYIVHNARALRRPLPAPSTKRVALGAGYASAGHGGRAPAAGQVALAGRDRHVAAACPHEGSAVVPRSIGGHPKEG